MLNDVPATVVSATATQLTVTVPKNMNCSGKITVKVGSRAAISMAHFTYVPTAIFSTFAGSGIEGSADGIGTAAQFRNLNGITRDASGNLYVASHEGHCIRKITPAGVVTTFAGNGTAGFADGTGMAARFNGPYGITIDASGNLYVVDYNNHRIRKITPAGVVSTFAGSGTAGSANGTIGNIAQFNCPFGIAIDASDNLYVTEQTNHRIRKITPAGGVTTFVGSGTAGSADGAASAAQFHTIRYLTADVSGNLYVPDTGNRCIRRVTPAGVVSTLTGNEAAGFADSTGSLAHLGHFRGITIDASGNLYASDAGNNRICKIVLE
jgi:DNA-binding beta-propeller fold protein YncE